MPGRAVALHPRTLHDLALPHGRSMRLGERTLVMGVVNVTPDSFASDPRAGDPDRSVAEALRMVQAGADILDIGGESTRPGASPVDAELELARVIPVIQALAPRVDVPLSVDTYKAVVAQAALEAGASIVNDISALRYDSGVAGVVASHGAGLVLMHSRGSSSRMYREANYEDVAGEIVTELADSVRVAEQSGVSPDAILLDPGLGFAKRADHSFTALADLEALAALGRPVVVGPSRKSFLTAAIGDVPPTEREWATAAAVSAAVLLGAHVVRVHAVREMVDVVRVVDRVRVDLERRPVGHDGVLRDE